MSSIRFGLDIGGTKVHGIALGPDGAVLAETRAPTEWGREGVVRSAAAVIASLHTLLGGGAGEPIGVGIPGIVDAAAGTVKHAVNLGLDGADFPLADLLGSQVGAQVSVENDTNAATLGARALAGADDLVYLSLGTGLAAGVCLDGRLRRGIHGAAGEIGHLPVDPAGPVCGCGQRGCLELVASGAALAAAWPGASGPAAQAVFDAAAAAGGDPRAVVVRDRFAAGVAAAVRALALAVDPELVVIGGGVAAIGEPLRVAVAAALAVQAETSPFLASLELAGRLRVVTDAPVAAIGAALLTDQLHTDQMEEA